MALKIQDVLNLIEELDEAMDSRRGQSSGVFVELCPAVWQASLQKLTIFEPYEEDGDVETVEEMRIRVVKQLKIHAESILDMLNEIELGVIMGKTREAGKEEQPKKPGLCDKCGKEMVLRQGKHGKFYGCTGFPECKGTRSIPS